jgi:hypothetical protein
MPTYQRCPTDINELANEILCQFETHKPLLDAKVKIDFVFAMGDVNEKTGEIISDAIVKNGVKALGLARKLSLKDRAMGRGDAEITLDRDHWARIGEHEQRAILDHELHHLSVKIDKRGLVRDDLGRPVIVIRDHDYEFGWFRIIAERHGKASIEVQQASIILGADGQLFWPALCK